MSQIPSVWQKLGLKIASSLLRKSNLNLSLVQSYISQISKEGSWIMEQSGDFPMQLLCFTWSVRSYSTFTLKQSHKTGSMSINVSLCLRRVCQFKHTLQLRTFKLTLQKGKQNVFHHLFAGFWFQTWWHTPRHPFQNKNSVKFSLKKSCFLICKCISKQKEHVWSVKIQLNLKCCLCVILY